MHDLTQTAIEQARARIAPFIHHTPLERSRWLSKELGREVFTKLECLQTTGSFKLRGAMAKLTSLSEAERRRGVLTVSAGNHGLAVAHGAEALGIRATVVVPVSASRAKVAAISRYPVTLLERGATYDDAERAAREMERETGLTFISPYNDAEVIAGQATIALEMFADVPELDAVIVPVGGGGLIAGVALAAKAIRPAIKIYGAEPAATPTMRASLRAGQIVEIEEEETVADGLAGNIEPGSITFPLVRQFVDEMILVSEEGITGALAGFAHEEHLLIEGSAAVSLAALRDPHVQGQRLAAIVTGRNITLDLFSRIIARHL
jgi:threonine dehydratase